MNPARKYKILLVDKNSGGAIALNSLFSKNGYEVVTVSSFLKAIEYCLVGQLPDLVFVDIHEPAGIFWDFPEKFKQRTGGVVPFVAHSIIHNKDEVMMAAEVGYKEFLIRPIEPEILLDTVANIMHPNMKLSEHTFRYHIDEDGQFTGSIHIDFINEFGIEASTHFSIHPDTTIKVNSKTLESVGIRDLKLKMVKMNGSSAKFSYVGLNSEDLKKIRKLAMFKGATNVD